MKKRNLITTLMITGILAVNSATAFAAEPVSGMPVMEQQASQEAVLKSDQQSVLYTNFTKNGGGEQWVKLTLEGALFNTGDPNEIKRAISQNYDIQTTVAVCNDGKSIELGVFAPNAGIKYLPDWDIRIDASVLTSDSDMSVRIPVIDDVDPYAPNVITSKKSVSRNELEHGFDLDLQGVRGVQFNTSCLGNNVRLSIMNTANIPVMAITYCDYDSTHMSFQVQALNPIPLYTNVFTFKIQGNAANAKEPITVSIPIVG